MVQWFNGSVFKHSGLGFHQADALRGEYALSGISPDKKHRARMTKKSSKFSSINIDYLLKG